MPCQLHLGMLAATMGMSKIVAGYVDQTSEEIGAAYTSEREHWLRNRSAARGARIRDLLSGERVNVSVTEATLGYRLRQHHVGLACWTGDATAAVDNITRLEYRIRKADESLGLPAAENRHDVELALQSSRWLGSAVLQPARERSAAPTGVR